MKETLLKSFMKYVSLNIFSSLGVSFYILADTFFIAKALGENGLAALNFSIAIFSTILGIGLMVGLGGAIKFSINAKNSADKSDDSFTISVILSLVFSCVYLIGGIFFSEEIAGFLGASGDVLPMTATYLKTLMIFSPFFILNNVMIAFIRNDNNPSLPMIAMITSSVANVILDYVFMFEFDWGIFGAILATCLSPIISLCILSVHLIRKNNTFHLEKFKLKVKKFTRVLSIGLTFFITEASVGFAVFVFNLLILNLEGNTGVAAYGVVTNISIVAVAIFSGISQGSQPLISTNYGRGEMSNVRKTYLYSIMTSMTFALILIAIVYLFTDTIVGVFNSESNQKLALLAYTGLRLYFLGYVFACINIISAGFLSAVSSATKGIVISIMRSLAFLVPCAIFMSYLFKMNGIWLSFLVTETIVMVVAIVFVAKFNHKQKQ